MTNGLESAWRGVSIEQAVDRCADGLVMRGLATETHGYSAAVLSAADRRLGRPMPAELRAFYSRINPVSECPDPEYGLVGFQPPDDDDLTWLDDPMVRENKLWVMQDEACWIDGWADAKLLIIGYTPFGDILLWADGLTNRPTGTIVLTDHESDDNPIILADSLGEWIARYDAFGLTEFAIAPAGLDDIDQKMALAFVEDYLRLNPRSEWAKQKLRALENG